MRDDENKGRPDVGPEHLPAAPWYSAPDDDEIDLFELWDILWSGRWKVILCTLVGLAIGVGHALLAPEIFESRVVMIPATEDSNSGMSSLVGQFGGLAALAGVNLGSGSGGGVEEAKAVLQSFAFISRFIESEKILPLLFAKEKDDSHRPPSMQDAVKAFKKILQVSDDKKTGAVTLTVAWRDPVLAAQWANQLVLTLNLEMRDQDVNEARRAIEFLNQKLKETNVLEMQQTLYRLIEAQTKTVMFANVRDDYVFKVIDPAYVPEMRSKPKRSLIAVLGAMLGGFAGVLLVFGGRVVSSYRARSADSAG